MPVPGQTGVPGPHCTPLHNDRIVLLGVVGGAFPSPLAAQVSSALVVNGAPYVIDFGAGLVRQMALAGFGIDAIAGVRHAFLTHHHDDHSSDYGSLLLSSWLAGYFLNGPSARRRIDTWGPRGMKALTDGYLAMSEPAVALRRAELPGIEPLEEGIGANEFRLDANGPVMEDENVRVHAARVEHVGIDAYGFRFDIKGTGKSVVFSGDTNVSKELIRLAKGVDVLVHEAIHVPDIEKLFARFPEFPEEAKRKAIEAHTTAEDVGRVAARAGAKRLVLNHLLPAFTSDAVWLSEVRKHYDGEVIVGRDFMHISLDGIPEPALPPVPVPQG